jgi:hypothetical protein
MASELTVQTLRGPTSGANADTVLIPSGQTLHAPGHVIQVVSGITSAQTQNSSTNTFSGMGLSLAITPTSSTSKILVITSQAGNTVGAVDKIDVRLMRDTTEVFMYRMQQITNLASNDHRAISYDISYVDSPSTTSAVTYSTQFKKESSNGRLDVQKDNTNGHITLMEIAQ